MKTADESAQPFPEALSRWGRRLITLPLYCLLWALAVLSLPFTLPLALVIGATRRRRSALARALLFFTAYLCCEVAGIVISTAAWMASGVWMGVGRARFTRWNFALERWWARMLMAAARRIYGMSIVVEDDVAPPQAPLLVLIRHVSVGDTLLPSLLVADRFGINLRYVLKRELLWDPCLDIVGNRLPNYFARRGSRDSEREIAAIQGLMHELGDRDGVLIYPEGTRFTERKRVAMLARLQKDSNPAPYQRARELRHVLPPRTGGVLGLLERNQRADVLFLAHVGFEGTMDFNQLLNGSLIGRVIRVGLWRIPFAEIPSTREARSDWLFEQWRRMDAWIDARTVSGLVAVR